MNNQARLGHESEGRRDAVHDNAETDKMLVKTVIRTLPSLSAERSETTLILDM